MPGIGSFLGRLGSTLSPRPAPSNLLRTPGFLPDGMVDPDQRPEDQPADDEQPQAMPPRPTLAAQMGGGINQPLAPPPSQAPPSIGDQLGGNIVPPPPENPPQFKQPTPPAPSPTTAEPMPKPPVAPNTPGGQKIGLARQVIGGLIGGQAPALRPVGERIAQGKYPEQEREYERQMGARGAQQKLEAGSAATRKVEAEAGEATQRGRMYGANAAATEAEGKRNEYVPFGKNRDGIMDARTGKVLREPAVVDRNDYIYLDPEKGKGLGIKPDVNGEYKIPKEGIGPYLTASMKPPAAPSAESEKLKVQAALSKMKMGGEAVPDAAMTDSRVMKKTIEGSRILSSQEKADAISWLGINSSPGATGASAVIRMEGYQEARPITVIDSTTGQAETMNMAEFNRAQKLSPGRYVQSSTAVPAMQKEATYSDIQYNIDNARSAVQQLPSIDAGTRAELANALADESGGRLKTFLTGSAMNTMTPQQRQSVIALKNLYENAMMLRGIGGMGQGSDQLRHAILATLPNATSPDVPYMLEQIRQFEGIVARLKTGVPGLGKPSAGKGASAASTPAASATATAQPSQPNQPNEFGYIVGRTYRGLKYLGGDPKLPASWTK